ncbi:MAG: O-antigen ligase domain-containing protein [Planctomycetota bacterium]|nr:MAG: O-antigen ligase domain-containing protein [Planctomycetota bacterium]
MTVKRKQPNRVAAPVNHPAAAKPYPSGLFATLGLALFAVRFFVPAESAALGDTLWIVVLWLLAGCFWSLLAYRNGERPLRLDRYDAAVWLLVAGHVISAGVVVATAGQQRAALNMLWEWIGVGLAVSLLRRWLPAVALRRQVSGVVCVSCILLAGLGVWQFIVWMPANRALVEEFQELTAADSLTRVEADRLSELQRDLGAAGNDRAAQQAYLERLLASEPIGRFALANTLAGLLAVGLLFLGSATADCVVNRGSRGRLVALAACLLLVAYCLILTKSRTAWLAALCGLPAWAYFAQGRRLLSRRFVGGGLAAAILVIALAIVGVLTGGLDRFVLSEAPKSMRYRLEYWRGTWGVITEHPVLGVGPGNFRQHYLKHKLPESSEEILDPHNLLLDAWANGGLIALAGLVAVVALFIIGASRSVAASPAAATAERRDRHGDASDPGGRWMLLRVGVCGLGLTCLYLWGMTAESIEQTVYLLIAWVLLACLLPRFGVSHAAWKAGGVALLVHLLAAGGLGMPAVCILLLLLLTAGPRPAPAGPPHPIRADDSQPNERATRSFALSFCAVTGAAAAACVWTAYMPVLMSRTFVAAAEHAMSARPNPELARRDLQHATESDPLDPTPWMLLAQLDHQASLLSQRNTDREFENAVASMAESINRDPISPKRYWILGQWQLKRALRTDNERLLKDAIRSLQTAANGYPNHSGIQASLAESLAAAGETEEARLHASRALELNDLNHSLGHYDRLLDDDTRQRLEAL